MPLIIIYALFFTFLAWQNLKLALAFLIFALPSYLIRFQIGFMPMTLLEIMILVVFLIWVLKIINKDITPFTPGLFIDIKWPIFLFLLAATISLFTSPDLRAAAGLWKAYFIEPFLFFLVFIHTFKSPKDLPLIFKALGFSALIISLLAIAQKFNGWGIPNPFWAAEETRRVTSVFGYPNATGLYLAPLVVLFGGLALIQKPARFFNLSLAFLSLIAIIFAVSKGALLGVLGGLTFLGVILNKKTRLATGLIFILLIIIILIVPTWRTFMVDQITFESISGQVRLEMWQETLTFLKNHPLAGAGLAGYQTLMAPYHARDDVEIFLYPHNIFLNFYSELGLLGLLAFVWLIIKMGSNFFEKSNPQKMIFLALLVTIFVHGLVDVPYFKNDLSIFFWLLLGLTTIDTLPSQRAKCL